MPTSDINQSAQLRAERHAVESLHRAAWKWSGLPVNRVIGSGTRLDTSRFRRQIAEHYGVVADNVHAYILGEHGDSQVALLSLARIAGTSSNS